MITALATSASALACGFYVFNGLRSGFIRSGFSNQRSAFSFQLSAISKNTVSSTRSEGIKKPANAAGLVKYEFTVYSLQFTANSFLAISYQLSAISPKLKAEC
jgi:hypothetical protein